MYYVNMVPLVSREHLPHACGVYIMRDAAMEVLYVGKANDLAKRVAQYFNPSRTDRKHSLLVPLIRKIDYIACASEREALVWERRLIQKYQPFFNSLWKDDKSYPYVKITMQEDYPRFIMTRQKKRDGALYFGPYPKVSLVKSLLRYLWMHKLFPLRPCLWDFSVKNPLSPKKIHACLYYHTRQCPAPCAIRISRMGYRKIAQNAAMFFRGDFLRLKKAWTAEMTQASKRLDFEKAARLRDNLSALDHMKERVSLQSIAPEGVARRLESSQGVSELQKVLALDRPPYHVEAFDISHFQGKATVGSMVCFEGGVPHRDHYRRFKIRSVTGIDDFRSIREVVLRRYRRLSDSGEPLPDLVLIDGGKGQLGMALDALNELKLRIPLAALAKREEEIFTPNRSEPIVLGPDSPARQLVERLRDEAHRFAVTYHRLLRKNKLLTRSPVNL